MTGIIGCDESLKGDTFGGIVIAAVKCDDLQRDELTQIGVKDCKLITDGRVKVLAAAIKRIAKYSVQDVFPREYNKHSLVELMNSLYRKAIAELKPCDTVVVDKFPGCNVGDICVPKAESKYIEVAAASILARDYALKQIDFLSKQLEYKIPLGSAHVKDALEFLKKSGKKPEEFVKMHFRNVKECLL